ncbi:O-antigen ligase family protein [Candidatus Daviesbacteria bacterium]|nr:O-antigen ligase family protein [Candidatus Daviesbacteria bacterium]
MTKHLLLLTIFLIPLLGAYGSFGYEQIKVLFFILSISLIGFIWLISKQKIKWNKVNIVSLLFILVLLLTSIFGADFKISLLGNPPYFQGWIVYAYLWLFSLVVAGSKIKFEHWKNILIYSAVVTGVLVIKDWFLINILNNPIPTYAGRVASNFGQPNFYAGFLLVILPFSLKLRSKLEWAAVVVSIIAVLISGSRIAIVLLACILVFWFLFKTESKKWIIGGLGSFGLLIGLALFFSAHWSTGLIWQEVIEPFNLRSKAFANPSDSVERRFYLWPLGWELINQKPLTGWGLENVDKAYRTYFEVNKHTLFEETLQPSSVLIRLKDLTIDRTHNFTLDLLLLSGILGFALWGILVCLLVKKVQNKTLFVSLVLYLIWVQFQNQSIVHLIYFWLLAGLINQES